MGLLTVAQVAERLGLKATTIRAWIHLGKIDYIKIGSAIRFAEADIAGLIERGRVKAKPSESGLPREELEELQRLQLGQEVVKRGAEGTFKGSGHRQRALQRRFYLEEKLAKANGAKA